MNFEPEFLRTLSDIELTVLQHEMRILPDDAGHLREVLDEIKRRTEERRGARGD